MTSPSGRKAALRAAALARRAAIPPITRAAGDAQRTEALLAALLEALPGACPDVPEIRSAHAVISYISVGSEPDTRALRAGLAARGVRLLLPRLCPGGALEVVDDPLGDPSAPPLGPGLRGIPAPTGPAVDPALVDLWCVPALAVDLRGHRLGRGGGSYDRTLPPGVPVLALLHEGELLAEVPTEPHDRPVTHVALPSTGVRRL